MTKKDKNILIMTIFAIIAILTWTLAQNIQSQKKAIQLKDKQIVEQGELETVTTDTKITQKNIIPLITAKDLYNRLFISNDISIIDTRTVEQFRKGHLEKSIHITDLDTIRLSNIIIFITETGDERALLTEYRNLPESSEVFNLKNGFNAWLSEGYNVISLEIEKNFVNLSKVNFIEPRDLDVIMKDTSQNKSIVILDVRRVGNYQLERLPNSINIPFEEIEVRHKELPFNKKIFVYGFDEDASFNASVLLYDLQHIDVNPIVGGFNAWKEYGYPTVQ